MNSLVFTKKQIFFTVVLLLIFIFFILYLTRKDSVPESVDPSPITTQQGRVYIEDLHKYSSQTDRIGIEKLLYTIVGVDGPDLYTATIRERTYNKTVSSSGRTTYGLVVDVQPLNISYQVSVSAKQSERSSINIHCAPQSEQLDKNATCWDLNYS